MGKLRNMLLAMLLPAELMMKSRMLACRKYFEILGAVIKQVSVDVMHVLIGIQPSAQGTLHNKSTQADSFPLVGDHHVAPRKTSCPPGSDQGTGRTNPACSAPTEVMHIAKPFSFIWLRATTQILAILLIGLCAGMEAEASNLTGTFRYANGNRLNGKIRLTLSRPAQDPTDTSNVVPTVREFRIRNGNLPSNATLKGNDILQPSGTYYVGEILSSRGRLLSRTNYVVTGSSFDMGGAVPTSVTTSNVRFQDLIGIRRIGPIRFCDGFAGADAGAKIVACLADLPSTGGVADARGLEGAINSASDITVPAGVTVLVGASTISGVGRWLMNADSAIVGLGNEATILNYTGSGSAILPQTSGALTRRVYLSGFRITGSASGAIGLDMLNAREWIVDGVRVQGFTAGTGVRIRGTTTGVYHNRFYSLFTATCATEVLFNSDTGGNAPNRNYFFGGQFHGGGAIGWDIVDGSEQHCIGCNWQGQTSIPVRIATNNNFLVGNIDSTGATFGIQFNSGGNFNRFCGTITATTDVDDSGTRNSVTGNGISNHNEWNHQGSHLSNIYGGSTSTNLRISGGSGAGDSVGQLEFERIGTAVTSRMLAERDGANDAGRITWLTQPAGGALTNALRIDSTQHTILKRIKATFGTSLVAGDFALSAGWGTTASVGTITGFDQWMQFTITSAGTGQGASPTATLTFKDGTWTNAPIAVCQRADRANQAGVHFTWTTTATTLVLTFGGTPVAAETFVVACQIGGI